jgi:hypothetical protein
LSEAEDEAEALACDGTVSMRALCKPARTCNDDSNKLALQAATGAAHPARRSNTITFTGIPATGATVSYEFAVPRVDPGAVSPAGLVQDETLTVVLPNGGETTGPLAIAQGKKLEKKAASGHTERVEIADRGSTLRVVGYSIRCVPAK